MSILVWTWIIVGLTFALYIGIAVWSRARSTGDFYVAAKSVHPVANGMATAADWMSAGWWFLPRTISISLSRPVTNTCPRCTTPRSPVRK